MAKILGDDIKEGRATKIQDDIIIGGQTQLEAARNYIKILEKFYLSYLRAEPEKPSHSQRWQTYQDGYGKKEAISRYLRIAETP